MGEPGLITYQGVLGLHFNDDRTRIATLQTVRRLWDVIASTPCDRPDYHNARRELQDITARCASLPRHTSSIVVVRRERDHTSYAMDASPTRSGTYIKRERDRDYGVTSGMDRGSYANSLTWRREVRREDWGKCVPVLANSYMI